MYSLSVLPNFQNKFFTALEVTLFAFWLPWTQTQLPTISLEVNLRGEPELVQLTTRDQCH